MAWVGVDADVGVGVELGCGAGVAAGRVEGESESEDDGEGVVSAVGAERAVGGRRRRAKRAMTFFMASVVCFFLSAYSPARGFRYRYRGSCKSFR